MGYVEHPGWLCEVDEHGIARPVGDQRMPLADAIALGVGTEALEGPVIIVDDLPDKEGWGEKVRDRLRSKPCQDVLKAARDQNDSVDIPDQPGVMDILDLGCAYREIMCCPLPDGRLALSPQGHGGVCFSQDERTLMCRKVDADWAGVLADADGIRAVACAPSIELMIQALDVSDSGGWQLAFRNDSTSSLDVASHALSEMTDGSVGLLTSSAEEESYATAEMQARRLPSGFVHAELPARSEQQTDSKLALTRPLSPLNCK